MIARVGVEDMVYTADRLFDYLIPESMRGAAVPGVRVAVPFGNGNRSRQGILLELAERSEIQKLKPLKSVLDQEPLIDAEGVSLIRWLSEKCFCTYYEAARFFIPRVSR